MKKKLLFKNTTQYSKDVYNEFNRFHNNRNIHKYEFFTIFVFILLVYCIIQTIKAKIIFLSILFIVVLITFVIYRFIGPIHIYKKEIKKKSVTKSETFSFYFYENYFKIRENMDFHKISYLKLHKVYETDKYFYLYVNKQYSFILDKSGFTKGTDIEFTDFIKNKVWFRYKKSAKE